jgi:hypothetical protein
VWNRIDGDWKIVHIHESTKWRTGRCNFIKVITCTSPWRARWELWLPPISGEIKSNFPIILLAYYYFYVLTIRLKPNAAISLYELQQCN